MPFAIEAVGLTKRYGSVVALEGIDLRVEEATSWGLIGANGAGKTTTARLLAGLAKPTAGSVRMLGEPLTGNNLELRRRMGVMPEGLALFESLTGQEYLEFIGRLQLLEPSLCRQRTDEMLQLMDLESASGQLIAGYSYGMKKKLALAAALLHRPDVLILDEPMEGVDAVSRAILEEVLGALPESRVTMLVTSNSVRLVERLCSRIAILDHGRIVLEGSLADLLRRGSKEEVTLESLLLQASESAARRPRSLNWHEAPR